VILTPASVIAPAPALRPSAANRNTTVTMSALSPLSPNVGTGNFGIDITSQFSTKVRAPGSTGSIACHTTDQQSERGAVVTAAGAAGGEQA